MRRRPSLFAFVFCVVTYSFWRQVRHLLRSTLPHFPEPSPIRRVSP